MTINGWIQIALFCAVVVALVKPLGWYMTGVFTGEIRFLSPVERALHAAAGTHERDEQNWLAYALAMLAFNAAGFLLLYLLQRAQGVLPLNPAGMASVPADLAFNTAVSFVTNTNWQNYGGESTMSYLVQMAGLTVQNFVSAATGISLALALTRGFARASSGSIGNFWVDLTRATLYVLLPICVVYALFLVAQGVPQTLAPYAEATTIEGANKRSRSARSRRRSRSRCSARTAEASSTPMPRIHSRIPPRCPISSRCCRFLRSALRSPMSSGAWWATNGRAGRCSARWGRSSSPEWP